MKIINALTLVIARLRLLATGNQENTLAVTREINTLRLREIMDERSFAHRMIREENAILGTIDADENFKYDITVLVASEDERIHIRCIAEEFKIPNIKLTDALLFCNKWNSEKIFPTAFVDPITNTFVTKYDVLLDEKNTKTFLTRQVLDRGIGTSWQFFIEAGKDLLTTNNIKIQEV